MPLASHHQALQLLEVGELLSRAPVRLFVVGVIRKSLVERLVGETSLERQKISPQKIVCFLFEGRLRPEHGVVVGEGLEHGGVVRELPQEGFGEHRALRLWDLLRHGGSRATALYSAAGRWGSTRGLAELGGLAA